MKAAKVVIIGCGVIGASVAYHLATKGCTDVLVTEQNSKPGEGSTGRATGGFRAQFSTAVNIRLSLMAREKLMRFQDELGADSGYRPCGYLFLAREQSQLDFLHAAQTVQKANGLDEAQSVSLEEIERLNGAVDLDNIIGGVFCQTDGFIRPLQILRGYIDAAARAGVRFKYNSPLTAFRMNAQKNQITHVYTSQDEIACAHVVNATGAWANRIAQFAGIEIPVRPLRRQVAVTYPTNLLPEEMPMTIFVEDGFHLRVRDGRALLLWPDQPRVADPFDIAVSDEWLAEVSSRAHARLPRLREVAIDRENCWAGLYEMSPDKHALLGRTAEVENFYLANGSSGHGVMHAPALGHLLAEIILDGRATKMNVDALRPTRFAEGQANAASDFL